MDFSDNNQKLSKKFYNGELLQTAKNLLGKIIVRKLRNHLLAGRIVEVEAYDGSVDEAAHSFKGITERTKVMFQEGGCLYVYFTYGAHYCANIVTGKQGEGKAVLIRAVEPLNHFNILAKNRFSKNTLNDKEKFNLTNGPGKFCKAFSIDKTNNGTDLLSDKIYLLNNRKINSRNIIETKRIGITKSVDLPWRFYIKENPYVSKQR